MVKKVKSENPPSDPVVEPPKLKKQKAVSPKGKQVLAPKPKAVVKPKKEVAKPAGGLSAWRNHLQAYKEAHPDVSLKQAMTACKATYKKA